MANQPSQNKKKVRVEITLHPDKHQKIIDEMESFGNQAGFFKAAAMFYINAMNNGINLKPTDLPIQNQSNLEPSIEENDEKPESIPVLKPRRRLGSNAETSYSAKMEE